MKKLFYIILLMTISIPALLSQKIGNLNGCLLYTSNCDDGDIKAGDADADAQEQLDRAFVAAVYLYESTGKAEYKAFAESNLSLIHI